MKVTEITATVMLVIGGGVLLLVLAGFRMYTQRKRAAARAAEKAESGEDRAEGDEGDSGESQASENAEDDPAQPSDPTPDTAAESDDPSGTGERVDR